MAGSVDSERQLTGILNLDDSFKVAKSVDRLSSLDPVPSLELATSLAQRCYAGPPDRHPLS